MEEAASNVARAIAAAYDWKSPPDVRKAAVEFLESCKSGEIHALASTSVLLVRKEWPSEIRLHGLKMLQHLVRLRWDELDINEREQFANVTFNLISDMIDPYEQWAIKSQMAALIAEVVRREGLPLWHKLLPSLVSLSTKGPIEAELVAMVLRWLPEDITVHNEDLEGDRRRTLLRGLTESLPEILPLLCSLLEKHYGAALTELQSQQSARTQQHAATVTAIINAINAYADWAPVTDLAKHGLIHRCGFLLTSNVYRLHACEFFKLVSQRKKLADATGPEFNSAMSNMFQILMDVSKNLLERSSDAANIEENEDEFMESVSESMVALGVSQLHCISRNTDMVLLFFKQMLAFFQHRKFALHFQSLLFWLALMRETTAKHKASAQSMKDFSAVNTIGSSYSQTDKDRKGVLVLVDDGMFAAILDMSLQRMLKTSASMEKGGLVEPLELWSDDYDGKTDFGQYRSRLLELIRSVASQKPIVAVARVSHRVEAIIKGTLHSSVSSQESALLESLQVGLETVVSSVFDGLSEVVNNTPEIKFQLLGTMGGLLNLFLSLHWTEPSSAVLLGRYLDAFGPYLKYAPDAISSVINKLFEVLTSLPLISKETAQNSARQARLQICSSFIRIARTADTTLLPHMKTIADTMAYLEKEGRLLRAEHNVLGEAFLVMASSAGAQQQQEVLNWLLEPLSTQWMQLEWQNMFLSDPLGLARMCSDTQFAWSIYHTVTFFEKALKRSGTKKPVSIGPNGSTSNDASGYRHPISSHMGWILPPLLKLLRSIHSLWSQSIHETLAAELKAAKSMSHVEQASLLGEGAKWPKGQLSFVDGSQEDINREGESHENNIRNWLKGIRDSGYNVIGLSATLGDPFFRCLDGSSVAVALMENVHTMEFRHIRQLVHLVVIPIVKNCPSDLWPSWLPNILYPLFLHCQQALTCSWSSLLGEGRAKVPDTFGNLSGLELKVEVMEEKLLRDLTREICSLLSVLALPALNSGLPTLEQLSNANRMEASLPDLDAYMSNSIVGFLLSCKDLALPALRICLEAFSWTDGEAVAKISSFCGPVIILATSTSNVELRQFVAKDMFSVVIQSLALESNAIISAELVGLCREIFVYLSDRDPAPRQVLMSLPCIKTEDLISFEDALTKTTSTKEQKQHMKSLLQLATGNRLKALAAQKTTNLITNVTARTRTTHAPSIEEEGASIGLAAIT